MGGLVPSNFSEFLEYISPGLFPLESREMPPLLCVGARLTHYLVTYSSQRRHSSLGFLCLTLQMESYGVYFYFAVVSYAWTKVQTWAKCNIQDFIS